MKPRVYRHSDKSLDWQRTAAQQWATKTGLFEGAQGGWIYRDGRPYCQGWGALFELKKREIRDWLTRSITSFPTFDALIQAPGGYRPTLLFAGVRDWRYEALAHAYDAAQRRRNDERRAYTGRGA